MKIKNILVTFLAPLENHISNGGTPDLGNVSTIKKRPDDKVYISGQMMRHSLFAAIDRLNEDTSTYVSNSDGTSKNIENDLRSDLGGFMHTEKGTGGVKRVSPVHATVATALQESEIGMDLLTRHKNKNNESKNDQAIAQKEFSQSDLMQMSFCLDVSELSTSKTFDYDGETNVNVNYLKHVDETERKRRASLFLDATRSLENFANQARNATSAAPQKVLIVLDTKFDKKAFRYFTASEIEQQNIVRELEARGAKYFIGDDNTVESSVLDAYTAAFEAISNNELLDLSNDIITPSTEVYT